MDSNFNISVLNTNAGETKTVIDSNHRKQEKSIPLGLLTGLMLLSSPNITSNSIIKPSTIEAQNLIETTNNNAFYDFNGKEFVMKENLSKDTFQEYKNHIDTRFNAIDTKLGGIETSLNNITENMVSKENLLTEIKRQSWKKFIAFCTAILAIWKVIEIIIKFLPKK